MSEDQIQDPQASEKTRADAPQPEKKLPFSHAGIDKPENSTNAEEHKTHRNAGKRKPLTQFELGMLILTSVAVLVAAVTGGAIIWQDLLARSSLTELHKQLVGTEAAVMILGFSVDAAGLHVHIENRGHVTAAATAHFVVTQILLPSEKPVEGPTRFDVNDELIRPTTAAEHGFDRTFPIPGLGLKEWNGPLLHMKQGIKVEISDSNYQDGFGGAHEFQIEDCYVNMVTGSWQFVGTDITGSVGGVPCSQVSAKYQDMVTQRAQLIKKAR
ncbi:MAG: hypothetical protein WAL55_06440 [Candidatus Acidiferrales bacterium]